MHPHLVICNPLQIKHRGIYRIANIQYYFYMRFGDQQFLLAMVSLFSLPDMDILSDSSHTVYLCEALDLREGLAVIPVTYIFSVVAMIPEMMVSKAGNITLSGKYGLMRHAFIELAPFNSGGLFDEDDEDETEE
jgi:hypothetical protein